jgi:peptidoglycan-associated lipoprotein
MNTKIILSIAALSFVISGCGVTHKPSSMVIDPNMAAPGSLADFRGSADCPTDRVFFDKEKYNIDTLSLEVLKKAVSFLEIYKDYTIEIAGHCDERGTTEYNRALGGNRAMAVKNALEKHGIPANRITISSAGKENPLCMGSNEQSWKQNRCSVMLLKKDSQFIAEDNNKTVKVMVSG